MGQVVDHRRRVVIPKHVAETLGIRSGDTVAFERVGDRYAIAKVEDLSKRLADVMGQDPERTGKPVPVSPGGMKRIWKG